MRILGRVGRGLLASGFLVCAVSLCGEALGQTPYYPAKRASARMAQPNAARGKASSQVGEPRAGSKAYMQQQEEAAVAAEQQASFQSPVSKPYPPRSTRPMARSGQMRSATGYSQQAMAKSSASIHPKLRVPQSGGRMSPAGYKISSSAAMHADHSPVIVEGEEIPEGMQYSPEPFHGMPMEGEMVHEGGEYGGCGGCGGGGCNSCGGCTPGGCNGYGLGHPWVELCWDWKQDLTVFGGIHSFEGPLDQGSNGNFGFHEGVNWSMPFWHKMGIGYQLGGQVAHSNFAGDNEFGPDDDRTQTFITTGFFRRPQCDRGCQWGLVYDFVSDDYRFDTEHSQIRGEVSYRHCQHELGVWFTSGVDDDEAGANSSEFGQDVWEAADMYALFHRQHFCGGGEARVWLGFTGDSDGIIGGDMRMPVTGSLALESGFNYLLPEGSESWQEAWSLSVNLVWHPCCRARSYHCSPYRPLFNVADNGSFIAQSQQVVD